MSIWRCILFASAILLGLDDPIGRTVRSSEDRFRRMLRSGYERSASFRHLIDRIGDLRGIVYVEQGRCGTGGSRRTAACLLHTLTASSDGVRILRVIVVDQATDRWVALVGHELQHVCEALDASWVVDGASMTARFRSLDPGWDAATLGTYETREAQHIETRITDELRRRHE